MHHYGKVSLYGFSAGLAAVLVIYVIKLCRIKFEFIEYGHKEFTPFHAILILDTVYGVCILVMVLLLVKATLGTRSSDQALVFNADAIAVFWRAAFLGWIFSVGLILIEHNASWKSPFGLYLCILSFFHYSEYLTTSVTSPTTLSTDSFLLNHSTAYGIAALASWIEYGLEIHFLPSMKSVPAITMAGFCLCVFGEVMRKLAMLTARENFTHLIRENKVEGHRLITNGVYKFCRHPSYAGWFWWSVGTQVLLLNPICVVAYAVASWNFFCYRITYEEATLFNFFGQEYSDYKKRVPRSGVLLVTGYKISD